ncbi:MAG: methionine biosynthesis protein MetW, partial [Actinobacteria bacterium]|nr:methionine biosynthesis protein MetW [Actinomycetota bacterium]
MRPDLGVVSSMIPAGARVLDLGCGDGALLDHLIRDRGCDGVGVEIAPSDFNACVARGVPVVEGDIDEGLSDFPSGAFDAVVLSQTLQATRRPAFVLREMARVGALIVVSFPNFGHWTIRLRLAAHGRMPSGRLLPYPWHETPNIHLCTIADFETLARSEALRVDARVWLDGNGGR